MKTESESFKVWNYKPWWCQPWSIIATGIVIISASWLWFKIFWLTILLSVPIVLWWGYFLILYPRLAKKFYLQQQKNLYNSDLNC